MKTYTIRLEKLVNGQVVETETQTIKEVNESEAVGMAKAFTKLVLRGGELRTFVDGKLYQGNF